jgi:uncharacterized protein (TIGR03663 family)
MSKAAFWSVFTAALALGLAFRLVEPGVRPMHHDEANQAIRFGTLLETGEYRYDRNDHHGPTLYYLTLPFAWIRGQPTLASLDERTLRMVPAIFGAATILLLLALSAGLGRATVAASAGLAAISPALTYYSRFYIQESLFTFFTLAFLIALGRYALRPRRATATWAGVLAGLAYATKETSLIVLPAAIVSCAFARMLSTATPGGNGPRVSPGTRVAHAATGLLAALLVALVLFSAFFRNPSGLLESFRAFAIYLGRGVETGPHAEPWYYYLRTLAWSSSGGLAWTEALVLSLAVAGIAYAVAVRRRAFWPLYVCAYSVITAAVFSALPYKTPWNLLPFYIGIVLLAGTGTAALMARARSRQLRALLVVVLAAATWQLAVQSRRANFQYPADPRNPYAYAQTSTDFLRLTTRVHDLAARHPDGRNMLVKVLAGPYEQWPFPWYARDLTRVGYWSRAAEAGSLDDVPVIVASQENVAAVDAALGDRYVSEFYGLRPGVLLTVYIDRRLWERFLESRR